MLPSIEPEPAKKKVDFKDFLEEQVALLITCGHRDAWDYGYSFFITACESLAKFQKMQIMNMTTAISLCFADKQTINDFMKD